MGYYSEINELANIQEFVKRLINLGEKTSVSIFLNINCFETEFI